MHNSQFGSDLGWKNNEVLLITRYKERIKEIQDHQIKMQLLKKQSNKFSFYNIVPKQQLPKIFQKMNFQTIHVKDTAQQHSKTLKIFTKQKNKPIEIQQRKLLKDTGNIMLLSEIYQKLGQGDPIDDNIYQLNKIADLEEWSCKKQIEQQKHKPIPKGLVKNTSMTAKHFNQRKAEQDQKFKLGNNYKQQVQKALELIQKSHNHETLISKFAHIENSSKLLKIQLDSRISKVQEEIQVKNIQLQASLSRHHELYEERALLKKQEKQIQQKNVKQQSNSMPSLSMSFFPKIDKNSQNKQHKKQSIQNNSAKIAKISNQIEILEEQLSDLQQDLEKLYQAEKQYFLLSLKNGIDCRQYGLTWILHKLIKKLIDIDNLQLPPFLDKKSKSYILAKVKLQKELQKLQEEKKIFMSQIGSNPSSKSIADILPDTEDGIQEKQNKDYVSFRVPARYRRSQRKLSILQRQYHKNQPLFQLKSKKGLKLSSNLDGLNCQQIYSLTSQRIKKLSFNNIRRQKNISKNKKIMQYQTLLQSIKNNHIYMEELDIQQQNHLIALYSGIRDDFLIVSAACFGVKKAYSLLIKNFSIKNVFGTF